MDSAKDYRLRGYEVPRAVGRYEQPCCALDSVRMRLLTVLTG